MEILFLETRELSYFSSAVFMEELKRAFLNLGDNVQHFIVRDINESEEVLENVLKISHKKHFDFIFDINSILPLLYEDDKPYLDCFDVPFVDYIVDHPVHQAHVLGERLENFNVICLDKEHCDYIKKGYPYIKNTMAMPLAATTFMEKENIFDNERKIDILFPATYTPVSYFEDILKNKSRSYFDYAKECIETIKDGGSFAVSDMQRQFYDVQDRNKNLLPDISRYIDKYIRESLRQMVVEAVLGSGFTLDVVGARWEMYEGRYRRRLNIHKQTTYSAIPEYMRLSKAVLNVQPLFKNAPHDRIYNAIANGAVAVTDRVSGLSPVYEAERDYLEYNFVDLEEDFERIKNVIFDNNGIENIRYSAYQKAMQNDTWINRCEKIKKFVKNLH